MVIVGLSAKINKKITPVKFLPKTDLNRFEASFYENWSNIHMLILYTKNAPKIRSASYRIGL